MKQSECIEVDVIVWVTRAARLQLKPNLQKLENLIRKVLKVNGLNPSIYVRNFGNEKNFKREGEDVVIEASGEFVLGYSSMYGPLDAVGLTLDFVLPRIREGFKDFKGLKVKIDVPSYHEAKRIAAHAKKHKKGPEGLRFL